MGPLRDRSVTGLLQASVVHIFVQTVDPFCVLGEDDAEKVLDFQDGLVRVLLDGGPGRVYSPDDAKFLEDDLEALKVRSESP